MKKYIATTFCLLLCAIAMALNVSPARAETASPEWIGALRAGGHVIVFRHGATYQDQADTDPLNLKNVDKQRHLNDSGRALAKSADDRSSRSAATPDCR